MHNSTGREQIQNGMYTWINPLSKNTETIFLCRFLKHAILLMFSMLTWPCEFYWCVNAGKNHSQIQHVVNISDFKHNHSNR